MDARVQTCCEWGKKAAVDEAEPLRHGLKQGGPCLLCPFPCFCPHVKGRAQNTFLPAGI